MGVGLVRSIQPPDILEMDSAEAWPRGATPQRRSGAATESARLHQHRSGREELPHARGQWWQPRGATTHLQEEQPHIQGTVAARAKEGREKLLHIQGQEEQP